MSQQTLTAVDARPGLIYALCDPRTHAVRYIGKTASLKARMRHHRHDAKRKISHLYRWWRKLNRAGVEPEVKIMQHCLPGMLDACEQEWIARGRDKGWKLCNVTEGGDGATAWVSDEARAQQAELAKAKWADPVYQANHRAARARRKNTGWHYAACARRRGMGLDEYKAWREEQDAMAGWNRLLNKYNMAINTARKIQRQDRIQRGKQPGHRPEAVIDGSTVRVPLTNHKWALIDAEDWPRVKQHLWSASRHRGGWRAKTNANGCMILNRFIMRAQAGEQVRFRNGDMLDCRKCNLEVEQVRHTGVQEVQAKMSG